MTSPSRSKSLRSTSRQKCSLGVFIIVLLFTIYVFTIITLSWIPSLGGKQALANYDKNGREKLVVPNLVHFTWFNADKPVFRFHHYLSVLSTYKFLKPKSIYFWHDFEPQGPWWLELHKRVNITLKKTIAPTAVFNQTIHLAEHKSDVLRLELLLQYGGIYLDLDVIVLKSFDKLRIYDTTLGYESSIGLCNGIILSRPQAPFLKLWLAGYQNFNDKNWSESSVLLPAKLALKYGDLVHTEKKTLNYPGWTTAELQLLYGEGDLYDWSGNYAVHLWYRFHNKEYNPLSIRGWRTTCGQIFRYVYYGNKKLLEPNI